MAGPDRRIALLGLLVVTLAIGASGLHGHNASSPFSTSYECATCVLAQTPSTIAFAPALIAPVDEEVGVKSCEGLALPCDLSHARSDTTRGPPHHG